MRMFLYLPLEHSENLDDQLESVRLSCALAAENPALLELRESTQKSIWKYSVDLEGSQVETMPWEDNPRRKK